MSLKSIIFFWFIFCTKRIQMLSGLFWDSTVTVNYLIFVAYQAILNLVDKDLFAWMLLPFGLSLRASDPIVVCSFANQLILFLVLLQLDVGIHLNLQLEYIFPFLLQMLVWYNWFKYNFKEYMEHWNLWRKWRIIVMIFQIQNTIKSGSSVYLSPLLHVVLRTSGLLYMLNESSLE